MRFWKDTFFTFCKFLFPLIFVGSPASGCRAQLSNVTLLGFFEFSISDGAPCAGPRTHHRPPWPGPVANKVQVGQQILSRAQYSHFSRVKGYFLQALCNKGVGNFTPRLPLFLLWCSLRWFLASFAATSCHKPLFLVGGKKLCKNLPIFWYAKKF